MAGKKIEIDIPELANTNTTDIDIVNTELSSSSFIPKGVLNRTKIIFTPTTLIRANTNIRIKLIEPNLGLSSNFTANDNYISNTISTIVV